MLAPLLDHVAADSAASPANPPSFVCAAVVQVKVTKIVMEAMDTSVQAYLDKGRPPNTTGKPPPLPFVRTNREIREGRIR